MQDEDDGGHCDGADGEVDVEAPTPGYVVGEGAAEEGACDALEGC